MLKFVLGFTLIVISQAHAGTVNFAVDERTALSIVAEKVTFRATAQKNLNQIKIVLNPEAEAQFTLSTEGGLIQLRPKPSSGLNTENATVPATIGPVIELAGPSIPIDMKIKSGQIQFTAWEKDALVNIFSGSVLSKDGRGALVVITQKAPVNVFDHKGKLTMDSYGGTIRLKNIEGDVVLESFLADLFLESVLGATKITSYQSSVRVSGGEGQLSLDMSRGSLNSQQFKGRIEGDARETQVLVKMHQDSDVNLKTKSGKISVQGAASASPYVSLFSTEGEIYTPSYLRVQRDPTGRYARGRLRGGVNKGSIVLRAEDGSLTVQ